MKWIFETLKSPIKSCGIACLAAPWTTVLVCISTNVQKMFAEGNREGMNKAKERREGEEEDREVVVMIFQDLKVTSISSLSACCFIPRTACLSCISLKLNSYFICIENNNQNENENEKGKGKEKEKEKEKEK